MSNNFRGWLIRFLLLTCSSIIFLAFGGVAQANTPSLPGIPNLGGEAGCDNTQLQIVQVNPLIKAVLPNTSQLFCPPAPPAGSSDPQVFANSDKIDFSSSPTSVSGNPNFSFVGSIVEGDGSVLSIFQDKTTFNYVGEYYQDATKSNPTATIAGDQNSQLAKIADFISTDPSTISDFPGGQGIPVGCITFLGDFSAPCETTTGTGTGAGTGTGTTGTGTSTGTGTGTSLQERAIATAKTGWKVAVDWYNASFPKESISGPNDDCHDIHLVSTVLGCLPTKPNDLIAGILGLAIGLAGGIALLLMGM